MAIEAMTTHEFLAARKTMGWPRTLLAEWFGVNETIVRRMEFGERSIPPEVATWLRQAVRWLENNPPPDSWRKR
jgi:hypothetical protein